MIESIARALVSEVAWLRNLGTASLFCDIEVHLTEKTLNQLIDESVIVRDKDVNVTRFMNYPIVLDDRDFIATVHKVDIE